MGPLKLFLISQILMVVPLEAYIETPNAKACYKLLSPLGKMPHKIKGWGGTWKSFEKGKAY